MEKDSLRVKAESESQSDKIYKVAKMENISMDMTRSCITFPTRST